MLGTGQDGAVGSIRSAWLRDLQSPALAEELRVALDELYAPVLQMALLRGLDPALFFTDARTSPARELGQTFEQVLVCHSQALWFFDDANCMPPSNLIRLCALLRSDAATAPDTAAIFGRIVARACGAMCAATGPAVDLAGEPQTLEALVASFGEQFDQLAVDIQSVDPFSRHANLHAIYSVGQIGRKQPAFLAVFTRSPSFAAAPTILGRFLQAGQAEPATALADLLAQALAIVDADCRRRLVELGAIEVIARAFTVSIKAVLDDPAGPSARCQSRPDGAAASSHDGLVVTALRRITDVFAACDAPSDIVDRLGPLLPGLIVRSAKLALCPSPTSVSGPIKDGFEAAWMIALMRHVDAAGRFPCGDAACSAFATLEAPFKMCSRCRFVGFCSSSCLVRDCAMVAALTHRAEGQLASTQARVCTTVVVIGSAAAYLPPRGDVRSDRAVLIWLAAPLSRCRRDSSCPWSCATEVPARPALTRSLDGRFARTLRLLPLVSPLCLARLSVEPQPWSTRPR